MFRALRSTADRCGGIDLPSPRLTNKEHTRVIRDPWGPLKDSSSHVEAEVAAQGLNNLLYNSQPFLRVWIVTQLQLAPEIRFIVVVSGILPERWVCEALHLLSPDTGVQRE
jgi:hypothetical protein